MLGQTNQAAGTLREYTVCLPDGVQVRTIDEGHGPIVLLLHGIPDNADEWKVLINLLKNDMRCIAPDLPGYGRRNQTYALPNFDYSREAQIGFVDSLLTKLNIQGKVRLMVHDIGGIMGVPWAASHLDKLEAVMYTNTVVFPKHQWFKLAYRWGNNSALGRGVAALSMRALGWFQGALFRRVFSRQNPQLGKAELDRFVVNFAFNWEAKHTTIRQFRQLTKFDFFDGYDQMLKVISEAVPTAAVWGEGDPYIPNHRPEELLARKTIALPGVGHWVPILAADVLAEQLRALS